jgi:phage tail P2-like protein
LWNPQTCPLAALPWLAWTLSIDKWDTDWTEERKRTATARDRLSLLKPTPAFAPYRNSWPAPRAPSQNDP